MVAVDRPLAFSVDALGLRRSGELVGGDGVRHSYGTGEDSSGIEPVGELE